jgi:sterol 3beta-glucosyltransferase
MSVISESSRTAPHLHSAGINMLETGKPETSPSLPQGLEQSMESKFPSTSATSADEFVAFSQYVPAGTPGAPATGKDTKTDIPLLTTYPTQVQPSVLPNLASSAGDREGIDESPSLGVVSAILLDDSRNGSQALELEESVAAASTEEEKELNEGKPLYEKRSPPSLVVRDDTGKPSSAQHGNSEESVHLIQNIYAGSGGFSREDSVARSSSMPPLASSGSEKSTSSKNLRRSNTEKKKDKNDEDDASIRNFGEPRMSTRRKKKLLRKLATIKKDGAVEFDPNVSSQAAKDLFGYGFTPREPSALEVENDQVDNRNDDLVPDYKTIPPLKIVMLIVGTRGDVQPFIAIGKKLQEYGHRVRLASHKNFKDFVRREGLEFYPLGGDPVVLAGYMVKNKGFLPSNPSEIPVQREQIKQIVYSLLPACIEPDMDSKIPFQAQAIIANPPAYGHVHVAEYLKIPLHIFFTMPWTPTSKFPHPLSRVKPPAAYRMSYGVVDTLIWLGIRGIINSWRKKHLKLRPINYLSGVSQGSITEKPTGYIWSPHLVPKPKDWGPLVDVVGFCFLNLATDYKPPEDLLNFLKAGPPPIYIGFGSLPVEDPEGMTKIIIEALDKSRQRGIIGKGWGGIGNLKETPPNVFLLSDCPHDWLFPQCAAVVHHGGAGTTSAGLKAACPTTIIPFFGDQPFWGDRVHEKGVGPAPIPVNHFSLDKLVHAIEFMMDPAVKQKAVELSKAMESEDGIQGAVNAFHKHIHPHLPEIVCKITPTKRSRRNYLKSWISCFTFHAL